MNYAWSAIYTMPVSYTHLDVYKRQGVPSDAEGMKTFRFIPYFFFIIIPIFHSIIFSILL